MERDLSKEKFWGWEHAVTKAKNSEYPGIETPRDLYVALCHVWSNETCAPRFHERWTPDNATLGQCSVTAFLVQDIFGGEVRGVLRPAGNYHCFNVTEDGAFDLTSDQYRNEDLDYSNAPIQLRENHFAAEEKRLRYEKLKALLCFYNGLSEKSINEMPDSCYDEEYL